MNIRPVVRLARRSAFVVGALLMIGSFVALSGAGESVRVAEANVAAATVRTTKFVTTTVTRESTSTVYTTTSTTATFTSTVVTHTRATRFFVFVRTFPLLDVQSKTITIGGTTTSVTTLTRTTFTCTQTAPQPVTPLDCAYRPSIP